MKSLRIIDQNGNKEDVETEMVPRVGERVVRTFRTGNQQMADHFYRVKDVEYWFDHGADAQVRILIEEEQRPDIWPS